MAEKINLNAAELKLCDHCLGRIYGMLGHGLTNAERGKAIRIMYAMEKNKDLPKKHDELCELCGGIFTRLDEYAKYISTILDEYEYSTFSVGSKFSEEILEREKRIIEEFSSPEYAEGIGREFNRELGKRISMLTGKEANISNPDITVIVDTIYDDVHLEIKPLLIYGRYRKLVRGLPQTKWPSGKYRESVEEIIARPIMEITGGTGHALHGMGREDIDVRMLGNGRPFVIEIKRPRKRFLDLKELERIINRYAEGKVEVTDLKFATKEDIRKIKETKAKKRYRVAVRVDASEEEIKSALKKLKGKIRQRTPRRVAHRRADKLRVREVYDIHLVAKENDAWVIEILAESGTYIKELMHGDEGRTRPSLAEILGRDVEVVYLDVIEILDSQI